MDEDISEIKVEKWFYLDDDFADEGDRDLLIFFYVGDRLYRTRIKEERINMVLLQSQVSGYFKFVGFEENRVTIDINGKPVEMSHDEFFRNHFTKVDALKIAKHQLESNAAFWLKDNKIKF